MHSIGEVIGRPLRCHEEISPEAGRQQLLTWLSPLVVDGVLIYWAKSVTEPGLVSPTVEEVSGVPGAHVARMGDQPRRRLPLSAHGWHFIPWSGTLSGSHSGHRR